MRQNAAKKNIGQKIITGVLAVFIMLGGWGLFSYYYIPKVTLEFQEHNQPVIGPARGFYAQVDTANRDYVENMQENPQLLLVTYDLGEFLSEAISADKLMELHNMLYMAREKNKQVIFRAAYSYDAADYEDPKSLELILEHVDQIGDVLNYYQDIVVSVQAGMFGPWGEWHNSQYLEENPLQEDNRNALLYAWLTHLDPKIKVSVRRPRFLRDALDFGLDTQRLGFHNDALLADGIDYGTYDDPMYSRDEELDWVASHLAFGYNGGEMPTLSEYTDIEHAVDEFNALHLSYLNYYYNTQVLDQWAQQTYQGENALEYINNHLGYRLTLEQATLSARIKPGRALNIRMTIANQGFAPIRDEYAVYLLVKQGNTRIIHQKLDPYPEDILTGQTKDYVFDTVLNQKLDEENHEEIRIGIYFSNRFRYDQRDALDEIIIDEDAYEEVTKVPESQWGQVELASTGINYDQGINWIGRYRWNTQKHAYEIHTFMEE